MNDILKMMSFYDFFAFDDKNNISFQIICNLLGKTKEMRSWRRFGWICSFPSQNGIVLLERSALKGIESDIERVSLIQQQIVSGTQIC
jgi:hypothetical protein